MAPRASTDGLAADAALVVPALVPSPSVAGTVPAVAADVSAHSSAAAQVMAIAEPVAALEAAA